MRKTNTQKGFTLIEVTIVLMIGGLMIGGMAAALQTFLQKTQITTTFDRIGYASEALDRYLTVNGRFPCPAPLDAPADSATFGREVLAAPAKCNTNSIPAGTFRAVGTGGRQVRIGALPTRSMNLPDDVSRDAWGQRFLYAITEDLATDGLFNYANGAISIVDSGGNDIVNPPGGAHYVIVSSGTDKSGSFSSAEGVISATTCQGYDAENCDNDAVFAKTLVTSNVDGATHFDDYVFHNLLQVNDLTAILYCQGQKKFFDPTDPAADVRGCVSGLADISCPAGQSVNAFVGGVLTCGASVANKNCPSGQAIIGFSGGNAVCGTAGSSGGGQQIKTVKFFGNPFGCPGSTNILRIAWIK